MPATTTASSSHTTITTSAAPSDRSDFAAWRWKWAQQLASDREMARYLGPLLKVADHLNGGERMAWPARKTIAGEARCSVDHVDDAIRAAVARGHLKKVYRRGERGGSQSNIYAPTLRARPVEGGRQPAAPGAASQPPKPIEADSVEAGSKRLANQRIQTQSPLVADDRAGGVASLSRKSAADPSPPPEPHREAEHWQTPAHCVDTWNQLAWEVGLKEAHKDPDTFARIASVLPTIGGYAGWYRLLDEVSRATWLHRKGRKPGASIGVMLSRRMRTKLLGGQLSAGLDEPWDSEQRWRNRLCGWVQRGHWSAWWGPKPGRKGCLVPPDLIDEAEEAGGEACGDSVGQLQRGDY